LVSGLSSFVKKAMKSVVNGAKIKKY